MIEQLRRYRRDLHKIPEAGFAEFKTKAYLLDVLKQYPCRISEIAQTGLCAYFPAGRPDCRHTVAFRCDMDGLATIEENDVPYASTEPGMMHACGHDGHMAMLLGLAEQLTLIGPALAVNVLLIFQPAEEGPGGAKKIISSGILKDYDVDRIFAFHISPSETKGTILTRPGEFMAKSGELDLVVHGKSAHCSASEKGIDALYIACLLVARLYKMEKACLPSDVFRLLKFGKMESGIVRNAISDQSKLFGTLRSFTAEHFELMLNEIKDIIQEAEEEYQCKIDLNCSEGYPPILNDQDLYDMAKRALTNGETSFDFINLRKPSMASDDFSYYLEKVPGLYLFLGTGESTPLHSSTFDFDESILETGVKAYLKLLELPI